MYKARINFKYKGREYTPGQIVTEKLPESIIKMGAVEDVNTKPRPKMKVNAVKKSPLKLKTTFVSMISRSEVINDYFKNIMSIDMPRGEMEYVVFIDSNNTAFINQVESNSVRMGFASVKFIVTHDEPIINSFSFHKRGMRIASNLKKIIEEVRTPYLFMVEDDTHVPPDAYKKLMATIEIDTAIAYVTGVEVSRGQARHLGIAHLISDEHGEIIRKTNPRPRESGIESITGGGWYCWMGRTESLRAIEYRCSDEIHDDRQIGPDVYFVFDLNRTGYKTLVDWSIWCNHYDSNSQKWLTPDEAIFHDYVYTKQGTKWTRTEVPEVRKKMIGILLPIRKRPHNLPRFYAHWKRTTSGNSRIYLIMDTDDDTYDNMELPEEFVIIKQPNLPTVPKMNKVVMRVAKECDYVGFVGDDIRFRTIDWEELVIAKLDKLGKYSMIYINDLLQEHKLATHPVFTSELIKKVGYIGIPTLYHTMVDMGWMHLCTYLNKECVDGGCTYMPEVVGEHIHRDNNKAPDDILYKLAYSEEWLKHDRAEFNKYFPKQFYEDLKSLE